MTRARVEATSLLVVTALLVAAVVLVPWPLAAWATGTTWAGPDSLAHAVGEGLLSDVRHGIPTPGRGECALTAPTQFWRGFHLVKAVLGAALLGVAVLATMGSGRRNGVLVRRVRRLAGAGLAAIALVVTLANIQGAMTPLASVLSLLPDDPDSTTLRLVVPALRADLEDGAAGPLTVALLRDFSTYHLVLAVLAGMTALGLAALGVTGWRRARLVAGFLVGGAVGAAVVAAANVGTALDPGPALDAFLRGIPLG